MYLWDAKRNELYMRPLIQKPRDKGNPLTVKPLGFQRYDGYQSLSFPLLLSQTDPRTNLGKFTIERTPPAFVMHIQDIVNDAP